MAGRLRNRPGARTEKKVTIEDTKPQDEQEQEAEIVAVRRENAENNRQTRNMMDIGLIICISVTTITLLSYLHSGKILAPLITFLQIALLPLSFTPHWARHAPVRRFLASSHTYVVFAHFVLAVASLQVLLGSGGTWNMTDVAKWLMPGAVAGSVEWTRRGESDMGRRIDEWEKKKYALRGA